jgi:tRNA dimethylallyltransferase
MARVPRQRAVLIAGATASGKSALALEKARASGGVVINTDAMQVYDVLRVLTARPGADETGDIRHFLYGTVPPSVRFSTGDWLRAVEALLPEVAGRTLIFAGGTGLYFDALTKGFAEVPEVPESIVREVEAELAGLDRAARGRLMVERDPETAKLLRAPDPQRVVRALAVLKATGRPLASFQRETQRGMLDGFEVERIVLNPEREVLRERIARRFERMFDAGAAKEVKVLRRLGLDPSLPAMKAIGVPEIGNWLDGRTSREEAMELAIIATRQYAKRQRTWFRSRMPDWTWIDPQAGA